jgi:hypothetical protein
VTRYGAMTMWAGGEAALGRKKGGDNTSLAGANLTAPKNEENSRGRFRRNLAN